ncbi:hypothetical protein ZWY2020_038466 [Hordeum vulgare]|nr:hypothetical protein ZWY2020_038466 [Hordeum vulgare]
MELKPGMSALVTGGASGIGTKGGVVMFTRSLAPLKRHGVRVNVLCPEFVQTNMAEQINQKIVQATGGFLEMDDIINGAFELIKDESKAGACLWITKRRGMEYWPSAEEQRKYLLNYTKSKRTVTKNVFPSIQTPEFYEKIVVHTLSHNFRNATRLDRVRLRLPIEPQSRSNDIWQVVLVTAAAGGTGQFAVQYQGEEGWKPKNYTGLCEKILAKSQTVAGFFLVQHAHMWQEHLDKLFELYASGKLKVSLDPKKFLGVASAVDAVEYLHSGKSVGKVVVCIDPAYSQTLARL